MGAARAHDLESERRERAQDFLVDRHGVSRAQLHL